tara:strand:+ start:299 stop:754 length:456 start_codon:yes stop_codon:yes gene_type:complete
MITNNQYKDIQVMQGAGFKMVVTMDSTHTMSNTMTYSAVIVQDKTRSSFTGPKKNNNTQGTYASNDDWISGSVNSLHFNLVADRSAGTITLSLPEAATRHFSDTFEGLWDLIEYDPSAGSGDQYTRHMEGDVVVSPSATSKEFDTFTATVA